MRQKIHRILVTGGAGFIGSNFIHYYLKKYKNCQIINLDKLTYAGNLANLKTILKDPRHTFIKGNICDRKKVKQAMRGADIVVHFAAETHVDKSIKGPAEFIKTNVIGTQVLLEMALENKIQRFHHISTDEVFGALELNKQQKFSEKTSYDPRSPYSASKASSDHLVRAYFHTYGLPITISNCSNNYGPFQFPEKIIPLFILNALKNKPLPIYGDGKSVRDYIFVEDHCRAIDIILQKGKIGETYCIGAGAEKNGINIADTILDILKKPKKLKQFVTDRLGHDRKYAVNYSKIKKELGWTPKVGFEEGIKKTIKWYSAIFYQKHL
ncbi:dTDP-glucose 4,6-dehydratase [Candidatus Berkelbacteria bacterium CG_4_9_14_3_um_filter_39_23]|uniref:dTDP-glucose 4,6-dehydratase n=1 Tax=Candidatus Berkelbacteria bacterium CG_4_9_14_3_um_filter_39_23 TaxID=1974508 RepID=A0A2M8C5C2_9BACT|nr:MAG: dTDP-glucose 4,6-dehydratase [Candidatus Berkelbacteria bacterium CG_4_9_14_3_um_filter_39_23]